jgi:8-oxo-dGTP pyrophosphatase MutT (NUDIX family)
MQKYVLIFPDADADGDVMLIRKAKPEWQKGRLNLVGGKVEPGESFYDAAVREFGEETGLDALGFEKQGTIRSERSDWVIEVFTCWTWRENRIISEDAEPVEWFRWEDIKDDPALMDNLRTVIPLLQAGMSGWTIVHSRLREDSGERDITSIEWEKEYAV